jgi:hypothetical protein
LRNRERDIAQYEHNIEAAKRLAHEVLHCVRNGPLR